MVAFFTKLMLLKYGQSPNILAVNTSGDTVVLILKDSKVKQIKYRVILEEIKE